MIDFPSVGSRIISSRVVSFGGQHEEPRRLRELWRQGQNWLVQEEDLSVVRGVWQEVSDGSHQYRWQNPHTTQSGVM